MIELRGRGFRKLREVDCLQHFAPYLKGGKRLAQREVEGENVPVNKRKKIRLSLSKDVLPLAKGSCQIDSLGIFRRKRFDDEVDNSKF